MLFYFINKNKTIRELRKAASFTMKELSDLSNIPISTLNKYEDSKYKDVPKEFRVDFKNILTDHIGVI